MDCLDRFKCAACGVQYAMQSVEDPARLEHNPNPKWEVPHEVIYWQPSYTQKVRAVSVLKGMEDTKQATFFNSSDPLLKFA